LGLPVLCLLVLTNAVQLTHGYPFQSPDLKSDPVVTVRNPEKTAWVTCWNEDFKDYRTRRVESRVLYSPDEQYRALARVDAKAISKPPEGLGDCDNTSQILIARKGQTEYRSVFTQIPVEGGLRGNGIQLIDWSPDSRHLLAHLRTWMYFTEGWSQHLVIYTPHSDQIRLESLDEVFSKYIAKDCLVEARLRGFSSNNTIVLEARPVPFGEEPACLGKRGVWVYDLTSGELKAVSGKVKVKKFGRFG